jgi:hypothetical protein
LQTIRQAMRDALSTTSLRAIGRAVGLTASGVKKFLDGARPYESTQARLRAWYVSHAPTVDADAGHAALELLAEGIAPELRGAFREGVAELVGELHGEAGLPLPAWAAGEAGAAHAEGQRRRGARFATVEVAGAEPVVLVRQPFDGDPRAVVEAMGTRWGVWNGDDFYPPHRINRVRLGGEGGPGPL